jgi:hypothetical protein
VATQGNVQALPTGGAFVNWGSQRWFSEFDAAGNVVWNARVAVGFESYRGYRMPWVGRPDTAPKAAALRAGRSGMDVYASWNGATEVASWEVQTGQGVTGLRTVTTVPRAGFETHVALPSRARYVVVRARDRTGTLLGTSPPAELRG